MRPPRRPRLLSGEESRLWGEIAKLITPLRGRAKPQSGPATAPPAAAKADPRPASKAPKPSGAAKPRAAETPRPVPHPVKPATKPITKPSAKPLPKAVPQRPVKLADLAQASRTSQPHPARVIAAPKPPGLERRERMGLRRGSLAIDARIDLHGLYQADAHAALVGFLLRAREAGHARVLVVTGKGGDRGAESAFSERGVLRRSVPHWLRGAELGHFVLGFEEAARHHGGAGALYVRLRRR